MIAQLPIIELLYQDETGSKGALQVRLPAGTTYEAANATAVAFAAFVAPLTGCVLIRQRIIYKAIADPRSAADVGSLIKRCGVFVFETDDGLNQLLIQVPGLLDSLLETDGDGAGILIDTSASEVLALLALLPSLPVVNPFAVECDNLVIAYRQSRV